MLRWQDVHDTIGDAFSDALSRIRYTIPTSDSNRARWPAHELWAQVADAIKDGLHVNCSGVVPSDVIEANCNAKKREMDAMIAGMLVSRAAMSGVSGDDFEDFLEGHVEAIAQVVNEHNVPVVDRIAKARARYRLGCR